DPIVSDINDSIVVGLDKPLKLFRNYFYPFSVYGAGTTFANPLPTPYVEGDVRWVPSGWMMVGGSKRQTKWKIGSSSGLNAKKTIPINIYLQKQVFADGRWTLAGEGCIEQNVYTTTYTTEEENEAYTGTVNSDGTYSYSLPSPKFRLEPSTTGVKVSWDLIPGAERYRVFYKETQNGTWINAGSTKSNSFIKTGLTSGKTYYFTVRCLASFSEEYTSEYDKKGKSICYIAPPSINSASLTTTGIKLSWSAVAGAPKYRVFYKLSGANSWTVAGDTTSLNYTINGLSSGKTYVFAVRCVNAAGTSYVSDYFTKGRSKRFVKAPVLSGVSAATSGVTVKWAASPGAVNYRVFYKLAGASKWTKASDTGKTSYTVTGLTSGKTYVFTVRCLNKEGTDFTSAVNSAGKTLLYLAAPTVSASQASRGVKVSWSKVSGAEGYDVYRKISGETWTKIKRISGGTTVSYTDKTGKPGTRYYYTIRAFKGNVNSAYKTPGASAVAKASY
ncbi:MAG: fibronectin type III domain-containing protein, partial [Eubacteriales bacterium]|nr:fibronectin type III domain-containing protein [Eubacteriales bacterium]